MAMSHTSEQCQGRNCVKKHECARYVNTHDWPFPVMSKLCDGRYVAFVQRDPVVSDQQSHRDLKRGAGLVPSESHGSGGVF